jgi:deoxyadenosine/deoxycytidine kinase
VIQREDILKKMESNNVKTGEKLSSDNPREMNIIAPYAIVSLDGNIGAGKTTFLKHLKDTFPDVEVLEEPVGDWMTMRDEEGRNLLELFYTDKHRWAYTFQNCAFLTRFLNTEQIVYRHKQAGAKFKLYVTERSIHTDRNVFADMLHKSGDINSLEWSLYLKWFDHFASQMPLSGIIYINTSAETCKRRIIKRGRQGEEGIPMEYLDSLDVTHRAWMEREQKEDKIPVLEISTEDGVDKETNMNAIREFLKQFMPRAMTGPTAEAAIEATTYSC